MVMVRRLKLRVVEMTMMIMMMKAEYCPSYSENEIGMCLELQVVVTWEMELRVDRLERNPHTGLPNLELLF